MIFGTLFLFLPSLTLALPSPPTDFAFLRRAVSPAVGAVYHMTNTQGKANTIIASNLYADGTLGFGSVTVSGGKGGVGTVANLTAGHPHADGLFTQDCIAVSGSVLLAVNPFSRSVSMFKINPSAPTQLTLVNTVPSGGDFPSTVAINAATTMACVANSGKINTVSCFTINAKTGLEPIAGSTRSLGLKQTTPPMGPANTVSDIVFSPSGDVVVAVKGTGQVDTPGFLATYAVTGTTLAASPVKQNPTGGALTFSITFAPNPRIVLTTDPAVGVVVFNVNTGKSKASKLPGNGATCWSQYSARSKTFFTADVASNQIVELQVHPSALTTTILNTYHFAPGSGLIDLSISHLQSADFVHILNAGVQTVTTMSLAAGPGKAKVIQTFDLGKAVKDATGITITSAVQGNAFFLTK